MSNARTGWLGGLHKVLSRVETTHQPRPANENITDIPNGLDKLRRAIQHIQNELVEAQAERGDILQAWNDCQQEINAHLSKNTTRQHDAAHRLQRLRDEWVRATVDLGIRAEAIPPAINLTMPDLLPAPEQSRGETP